MEQFVILLVIGVISLVNWAIKKSQEKRAAEEAMREGALDRAQRHAARRAGGQRQARAEDPMRELMEALGLPRDAAPPVRVPAPPAPRKAEEFASLEEAAAQAAPGIKWARDVAEADEKTRALASAMAATAEKSRTTAARGNWRGLLSGREAQRRAFVAAEIFGRPRGEVPMAWPG